MKFEMSSLAFDPIEVNPTRILYDIHPHTLGGTERFLLRFLPCLDPQRYEPLVVSQKDGLPLQAIRSVGIGTRVVPDYFKATAIGRLADLIRDTHVGLVQSNYYSSNLAMAANLAGVPHVWRLGGHVDVGSGVKTTSERRWALDMIGLLSTLIICNSKYVSSQFKGSINGPRLRVIPNGITVTSRRNRLPHKAGLAIGMIAHMTPQKRHRDFILAAQDVCQRRDDVTFKIVGSAYADSESRAYAAKVQRWGRKLANRGLLNILEFVDRESDVYAQFDCVVLPSLRESFSNAILESMAAGVPVIAARSGGNPELVVHRKTGLLVPPAQPEKLARSMLQIIEDAKRRSLMGQAARARALKCFSLADCARSYQTVYSEVLAEKIA